MASIKCTNCGRLTSSATSNYILNKEPDGATPKEPGVATLCYAAFVDGDWVKGCKYDLLNPLAGRKGWIDRLIANKRN
ncbi:hypothetical protein LCGC14_0143210 [marine sediment metagenome]|uniref:Uncharacterized protein n=1 Tax=marine sediment metagenome TaxID=412755 RepID=A0A0F9Y2X5_9ZZZZ